MPPQVSVVIPVRNRADVLPRAVQSALAQTLENLEVIVVDDASTDGTAKVAEGFSDPRVRVVRLPQPVGAAAARNHGIDEAQGEFVAFLDSDDAWGATKLERQVQKLVDLPSQFGVVYTGYWEVEEGRPRLGQVPERRGDLSVDLLYHDHLSPTSTVLVETQALREVEGFDGGLPARQDYDLWLRLSEKVFFDHIPDPLTTLHVRGDSITSDLDARVRGHELLLTKIQDRIDALPPEEQGRVYANHAFTMGLHLHEHGERHRAVGHLTEAVKLDPGHWKAWVVLAAAKLGVPTNHPLVWKARDALKKRKAGAPDTPPPQEP